MAHSDVNETRILQKDKETKARLVYDVEKQDYVPVSQPQLPILNEFNKDLAHNLDVIFNAPRRSRTILWETLRNNFYYSAINVPKATDDFRDIDRALVWGSTGNLVHSNYGMQWDMNVLKNVWKTNLETYHNGLVI